MDGEKKFGIFTEVPLKQENILMKRKDSTKLCAYCGGGGSLTREHIIPDFLYRQYPEHKFGYHSKARRYLKYEAKIHDVCMDCNSGPLSALDAYGKSFVEENHCHRQFVERRDIHIWYDYDMLLRWLLKISYNMIRASGRETTSIKPWVEFILNNQRRPGSSEICVEIIRNERISREDRPLLLPAKREGCPG